MAGTDNLIPIKDSEVARQLQEKSVQKRKENQLEKKIFKDELIKRLGDKDFNEILDNLIARAKKDDKSFEVLRDTMGQKPSEKIEANLTYENSLKEVTDDAEY
jgi:hypothetical protein